MSDITINYKGSSIATMDASGTKTLLTEGKYCEDDIEVVYVSPGGCSVSGYGDPYTIMYGSVNYFAVGGVYYLFLDESNNNKRKSVWASSGEHSANVFISNSNYQTSAGVYPIPVPSGKTKVSVSPDISNQVSSLSFSYSNGWVSLGTLAWTNPPVSEYSLPAGTTHIGISLRVNEDNANYAYNNQPKTVEITFS